MNTESERNPLNLQQTTPPAEEMRALAHEGDASEPEILGAPSLLRSPWRLGGVVDDEPKWASPDSEQPIQAEPPLFQSWFQPEIPPPPPRIPHLGHLLILAILVFIGLVVAGLSTRAALHFRLLGISSVIQA